MTALWVENKSEGSRLVCQSLISPSELKAFSSFQSMSKFIWSAFSFSNHFEISFYLKDIVKGPK